MTQTLTFVRLEVYEMQASGSCVLLLSFFHREEETFLNDFLHGLYVEETGYWAISQ